MSDVDEGGDPACWAHLFEDEHEDELPVSQAARRPSAEQRPAGDPPGDST